MVSKKSITFAALFEDDSLAQQVEHIPFKDGVLGSNPRRITSVSTRKIFFTPTGAFQFVGFFYYPTGVVSKIRGHHYEIYVPILLLMSYGQINSSVVSVLLIFFPDGKSPQLPVGHLYQ